MNPARDAGTIFVFSTMVAAEPYAGYCPGAGAPMFLALTLPGGFSGFGSTREAAMKMARARVMISKRRAASCSLSFDDWFTGIGRRMTPGLMVFLDSFRDKSTDDGADDGLRFRSIRDVAFPRDFLLRDDGWKLPAVLTA